MKKKLIASLLVIAGFVSGQAFAADSDFYVSGFGNMGWHNKGGYKDPIENSVKFKSGFGGGIAVGYVFEQARIEIEGSHRSNKIKEGAFVKGISKNTGGKATYTSLMLNAYYDIPVADQFSIYLGGGIGFTRENFKHEVEFSNGLTKAKLNSKKTVFAWQLMAGVTYEIDENCSIYGGYRLFAVPSHELGNFGDADDSLKKKAAYINNIELGVRYRF